MFGHYLGLGVLHLRRNPVLTGLMVVTLAVGVAASVSTLTILRAMTVDPIPAKSDRLMVPLLDIRPDDGSDPDPEPPKQLTYRDAVALHDAGRGFRQSAMFRVSPFVDPGRSDRPPWFGDGLAVHADFFAMLGVHFVRGGPWTAEDDRKGAAAVVITQAVATRVFDDRDPIGRTIRMQNRDLVVTGVLADDWEPMPRFYRLVAGPGGFAGDDELLVPFATAIDLELDNQGNISCYKDPPGGMPYYQALQQSTDCVWLQLWVELKSPHDAAAYRDFLAGYVASERKLGRFPRKDNQRLYDVMQWLTINKAVPKDRRLQTYLAFSFLIVCLINTIGLLLAKFSSRTGEIGVRRALGATRRAVFQQYLIESGVIGLAGGVVGLGLTRGWLWVMAQQSEQTAQFAHLDWTMTATAIGLSIIAALVAGLLPTWRASRIQPALQLKSQ